MSIDEFMQNTTEDNKGEMIVFISSKGGVGKTVISVNTAVSLSNKGFSTCILDGSFQFGDVNLALDIQPTLTISDLIGASENSDNIEITDYLHKHDSGVQVLSAPTKPEYADLITSAVVPKICEKIIEKNDFLIVDLPSGLSDINLSFLELADRIFLVTDLEMAALKNTKTMLRTFKMLEMDSKVKVVVNRADMESLIKADDVEDILETEDVLLISNNFKVVSKSFNIGIPFVISKPKEKISSEIIELTKELEFTKPVTTTRRRQRRKHGLMGMFRMWVG
jgi:pilus assembly protein CpaE